MDNLNSFNKIRLNIILTGLLPSFLSLFRKTDNNLVIFNSHFNLKFNSNSKYLFFYFLENRPETVKFVINDDKERERLIKLYGEHFIETKSFKGKMYALKAKTWFTNSYDLPVGGFFLKRKHNVVCLSHGSPIKNEGTLEKDTGFVKRMYYKILHTNISHVLATADAFANVYSEYLNLPKKNIIISGLPQFDQFSMDMETTPILNNSSFKVLYAPTWRHFGNPSLFNFKDFDRDDLSEFLSQNQITIYLRLHPNYGNNIPAEIQGIKGIEEFPGSDFPDVMQFLPQFDGLITDYSSICLDFLPLDRPMFFMTSDYEEYDKQIGFCVDYNHWTPGYKPKSYAEFKRSLLDAKQKDSFKSQREQLMKEYACHTSGNCERAIKLFEENNILQSRG